MPTTETDAAEPSPYKMPPPGLPATGPGHRRSKPRYPLGTLRVEMLVVESVALNRLHEIQQKTGAEPPTDEEKRLFTLQQLQHHAWIAEQALSQYVRELDDIHNMPQHKLAEALGISRARLHDIRHFLLPGMRPKDYAHNNDSHGTPS